MSRRDEMGDEQGKRDQAQDVDRAAPSDIDEGLHVGFVTGDDASAPVNLETHRREHPHDHAHVDLRQEEYTPEEVARLIGTSLEVVMHAIWNGELKADRKGRNVVCIKHEDVTDWLRRRGPGV
jgi:excisionase family DNA binding protein